MEKKIVGIGLITGMGMFVIPALSQTNPIVELDLERRMRQMRGFEDYARRRSEAERKQSESLPTPELDKKAKERIRQMRMPSAEDVEKYRLLLGQKNTGIFKLFPDFHCLSENVIRLDGDCSQFVPESSNFAFREVGYTHPLYHDIGYIGGELVSNAFFAQGIFASLGNTPIDKVGADIAALKVLGSFRPQRTFSDAKKAALVFNSGISENGSDYSSRVKPLPDTTYAIRVIAYDIANSLPPVSPDRSLTELKFLSLAKDTRADITIVFRIIRKDEETGGLTIVWKELERQEAPKLRFAKGEALADFK